MKSEFCFIRPSEDGTNSCFAFDTIKLTNEKFKQELREKEGIFFDVSVSPNSPRKLKRVLSNTKVLNEEIDIENLVLRGSNSISIDQRTHPKKAKRLYTFNHLDGKVCASE